jgi:hypothetical protein
LAVGFRLEPRGDLDAVSIIPYPLRESHGSQSDIQEVVDNFIAFEDLPVAGNLGMHLDDLSRRVIMGAKGSGKTVYLRRLRAARRPEGVRAPGRRGSP